MLNGLKPDITIDCIGHFCPMPILRTRQAINKLKNNQILELISDDPDTEETIKYFTKTTGNVFLDVRRESGVLHFLIRKKEK